MSIKEKSGFTLIELLIVTSITVILLLSASVLFMTFLISNSKINSEQLVKQEGQHALSQIEFLLRNALEILPNELGQECELGMTEIKFFSIDGGTTSLKKEDVDGNNKIASNSSYLTSSTVEITDGPTFNCTQDNDESHPHINISFTLRKGTPGLDRDRDIVEEIFTSSTTVRSL
ncbi:MAG: type II secretion system protein [Candidatus Pacebacteria bacterium]|jgi:prepilin-type N-terminal cleavage/methylation domain-containing protein|nr:type II secretion system protein [Candidatus Paceibacterota bacterium]MBT3511928.1 type II secretion system protein [Candidatus Paceibacterota bacterium]MBT4005250.1 type II secretion system protein [Candidatus Paceibacterota bacterium]MBT4358970.1 type II secretion system protein [Candidatus Paceibacterota bacterium]MBT4680465.1 type II secretion system protein [Candidatus Paceibacterota bacterium]